MVACVDAMIDYDHHDGEKEDGVGPTFTGCIFNRTHSLSLNEHIRVTAATRMSSADSSLRLRAILATLKLSDHHRSDI